MDVVGVARHYYLGVLIAKVRLELSDHSEPEALALLYGYITFSETTREKLAHYLNRAEGADATAAAEISNPRIFRLLAGWKELFDA